MAVILTGMEMPKNCFECEKSQTSCVGAYCRITDNEISEGIVIYENTNNRPKDCPLKSVEGLIEKIKTDMSRFMYDDWGNTTTEHDVLVGIIREYCGLEDSNG